MFISCVSGIVLSARKNSPSLPLQILYSSREDRSGLSKYKNRYKMLSVLGAETEGCGTIREK